MFCEVLKEIKVSDAYCSRCMNQNEQKLHSLKSNDYCILFHDLLPIVLPSSLAKQVTYAILELCTIFQILRSKVLKVEELDKLQYRATIAFCWLEKIFPPLFFTITVHFFIHLPLEAKLGGRVHNRFPLSGIILPYRYVLLYHNN